MYLNIKDLNSNLLYLYVILYIVYYLLSRNDERERAREATLPVKTFDTN